MSIFANIFDKKDIMRYDFDKPVDRRFTDGEKYDNLKAVFGREDIIPLWIADMDFEVAPVITQAIVRRTQHPVYGYIMRADRFYDAVSGWLLRRNGWHVDKEWIGFSPGVVAGYLMCIRALTGEGDGILIQPPVYPAFSYSIENNGRRVVNNPMIEVDGRFEVDFEDMDRKLADSKVFLLCNPHNPSGRVFTHQELRRMGELCIKHNVYIVSDEIHSDLVFKPNRHIHIASVSPGIAARTITIVSPSKTFNIPGLATAVTVIPNPSLRHRIEAEMARYHIGMGNVFGNEALIAAYGSGDDWVDQAIEYIRCNMEYVAGFVEEHIPSVRAFRTEGTYLMWLDFTQWGMPHSELTAFMVDQAHLGLGDGIRFGQEGHGHMRINLATRRAILEQALQQLLASARSIGK